MLFDYTTELRNYFESLPENDDQTLSHDQVIENGRQKLFDFEYPLFDQNYRKVFETHFIRKFYMRQIGFETFGLFKFQLETWLQINMPYFNKLFESELIQYDPLTNTKVDVTNTKTNTKTQTDNRNISDTKTIEREMNTTSNRTGTTDNLQTTTSTGNTETSNTRNESGSEIDDNFNRKLESNNPDSRLALTSSDGEGVIEYASSIKEENENNSKTTNNNETSGGTETSQVDSTKNDKIDVTENVTDNTTANSTETDTKNDTLSSSINDIEDYAQHRFGKIGVQSFSDMMIKYRKSLLRVENQIFEEMNELFMLVY